MKKSQLIAGIKEALQAEKKRPGLWANINAKRKRGEKPAHKNSNAHKDAVKAGKKINKEKNEGWNDGDDVFAFGYNLDMIQAVVDHLEANYSEQDYELHVERGDTHPNAVTLKNPNMNQDDELGNLLIAAEDEEETDYQAEGTAKSAEELKSHIEALSKARAQAASKGQTTLLNSYHKEISKAQKQLKKLAPKQEILGANVNAKRKRGEKPSHVNSNAHKDAVAAGKAIKNEAAYDNATRNELAQYIINLNNELAAAKSRGMDKEVMYLEKDIAQVKAALAAKKAMKEEDTPQEWPKQISSKYNDEYIFKLLKVESTYKDQSGRALYRVVDVATGETKGTPAFTSVERLMAYAQDLIKPQGGTQSTNLGELEVPADVKAAAKASDQATGVQNTSKRIDQQSEFAGAFQDWFSRLGYKPGKITKSMITREVIKVLDSLNYK